MPIGSYPPKIENTDLQPGGGRPYRVAGTCKRRSAREGVRSALRACVIPYRPHRAGPESGTVKPVTVRQSTPARGHCIRVWLTWQRRVISTGLGSNRGSTSSIGPGNLEQGAHHTCFGPSRSRPCLRLGRHLWWWHGSIVRIIFHEPDGRGPSPGIAWWGPSPRSTFHATSGSEDSTGLVDLVRSELWTGLCRSGRLSVEETAFAEPNRRP